MKSSHTYLMAAAVVAVVLISVLAAPTLARTAPADAQSTAGDTAALTLQDDTNVTTTTTTPTAGTDGTPGATPTVTAGPSGTPAAIPGRIEAEDYDAGGQGSTWYDRTPGNQGGAYREDDVDIESGGSGYAVAYVKSSEWLTYSVDVAEARTYTATFRASSPWDEREVWVWVDGVLKAQVKVPNTGSFDTYEDVTANVALAAGSHTIRLQFYRDSQNLDYCMFEATGTGGGGQNVTPTPTATGTVTPTPAATGNVTVTPTTTTNVTPTQTGNVTPTPTVTGNVTGNVTPTPTPGQGSSGQGGGGANVSDLTNQNSPNAAYLQDNLSYTRLDTEAANRTVVNLELVAENLTRPMMLVSPEDNSSRLFVVEQTGTVRMIENGTVADGTFLDVRDRMVPLNPFYDERGLLSIAFHPNFSENGRLYAFYSAPLRDGAPEGWNCTNRLSEFTLANGSDRVDNTTERILMEIDKPQFNHNGGMIQFGPVDGYLYIPLGDGGGANDEGLGHTPGIGNAQDLTKIYGKILRIDVDTVTGNMTGNMTGDMTWTSGAGTLYGIPADNPFLANASIPPEIYAYGFRNPAFADFDKESNALIIAMAGQNLFESVQVVHRGGAYPWNIREGTHCFDPANNLTPPDTCAIVGANGEPLIGPVFEGGHDIGAVVVGGRVYRGSAIPELQGRYFFGYYSTNPATGNGTVLVSTPPSDRIAGTDRNASTLTPAENAMWSTANVVIGSSPNGRLNEFLYGFGEDGAGELYALTSVAGGTNASLQTGRIWKVLPGTATALNLTPATVNKTIVEVAAGAEGQFSTLVTAVEAANLTSTLAGPGPFTVFAPLNPAFEKLPPGALDLLLQDPSGLLTDVLGYHVVAGRYTLADLAGTRTLQTVSGENITVEFTGNSIEVEGAPILFPNVEAKNGVIHVINEVMIPPAVASNLTNRTATG